MQFAHLQVVEGPVAEQELPNCRPHFLVLPRVLLVLLPDLCPLLYDAPQLCTQRLVLHLL